MFPDAWCWATNSTSQAKHVHETMQVFSVHAHVCSTISVPKSVGPQAVQTTKHAHGKSQSTWQGNAQSTHDTTCKQYNQHRFSTKCLACAPARSLTHVPARQTKHATPCDNLQTSRSSSFIQSNPASQAVNMSTHSNTCASMHANHAKDTIAINVLCAWNLYLMKGAMFKQISERRLRAQVRVPKPGLLSANLPCAIFVCSAWALCTLFQCILSMNGIAATFWQPATQQIQRTSRMHGKGWLKFSYSQHVIPDKQHDLYNLRRAM